MKKPFLGVSLGAGQTINIPSGVREGLGSLLNHLSIIQGGILPDHQLEELGNTLHNDWESLHNGFMKMEPSPEKDAIETILDATLDISAPHTISGQPVAFRAVLHKTVHDTSLPSWLGDVNHMANSPEGCPELSYVIDGINKVMSP